MNDEGSSITRARRQILADTVSLIKKAYREGREWDCYVLFDSIQKEDVLEEILWLSTNLGAPERAAIKRFQESERRAYGTDENR